MKVGPCMNTPGGRADRVWLTCAVVSTAASTPATRTNVVLAISDGEKEEIITTLTDTLERSRKL